MKGYRFYEELEDKNRKAEKSAGNVVAVWYEGGINWVNGCYEAVCALFGHPNSAVCGGAVPPRYLAKSCRRVSEKRAREIHPRLFEYLDA